MCHFAALQINHVEADMFAQADVGIAVAAIDSEREYAALADIRDLFHE